MGRIKRIYLLARDRQIPASYSTISDPDGDLAIPCEQVTEGANHGQT